MRRFFPFLSWLPNYNSSFFLNDLFAGLGTGIILVPQGLAYALVAGLPPVYGLYASLFPIAIYAMLGTSRKLAVGPVAMDSLLIAAGLGTLAISGLENYIAMALLLTFMAGTVQLLLGLFKMGFLVNFLSKPVISGFTSAAALIISFSQVKHLFGTPIPQSNHFHTLFANAFLAIPEINLPTLAMGSLGIALLVLLKRWSTKTPSILILVILAIIATYFFGLRSAGVEVLGAIPKGLPHFKPPQFAWEHIKELCTMAIALALIGYMEAISIGKAMEEKDNEETIDANQELVALGTANVVGSFFQAFAITASFSRSAINHASGAKTPMASIVSVVLVVLTLLFLIPLFYYLPHTILAAIIMVSVVGLIDLKYPVLLWKHNKDELVLLLFTFFTTLFLGIKEGILFGVLFSLLLMVYRTSKPHFAVLGKIRGTDHYRNVNRFTDGIIVSDELLIVRFDAQLYFGNKNYFKKELSKFMDAKGNALKAIILNAEAINYIDSTAIAMLVNLIREIQEKKIDFFIAGAIGPTRDIIFNSALIHVLSKDHLFASTKEAVAYFNDPKEVSDLSGKVAYQNQGHGN